MKKVFAMLLALMMVMSLATTAFAADTNTNLTITGVTNRTFNGYQLLSVTVDGENYDYDINSKYKAILVDVLDLETIDPATEVTEAQIVEAIKLFDRAEDMRHFADDVYRAILAANIEKDATWDTASTTVAQGYWLIADVTVLPTGSNESNSLVMIDTAGDVDLTVAAKPDVTISTKKIDDENDSLLDPIDGNEDATAWNDVADYDIGDLVPYHIAGQLANNITEYTYYSFKIVDTASEGLTFKPETFKLTVNGKSCSIGAAGTTGVDFVYEIDAVTNTLTVYPNYGYTKNDKTTVAASAANGGDFLKLSQFADVTDHAQINSSTFNFTYSCELNEDAVVGHNGNPNTSKIVFSNNPYGDTFGETPEDTTIVFTYRFIVNKTDSKGNELKGADFDLYKFVAKADQDAYTEENAPKDYILHPSANAWGEFVLVEKDTATTADTVKFSFTGLDDGYYKLVETTVPEGYNEIDPIEFHVIADHIIDLSAGSDVLTDLRAITKVGGELPIDGNEATGELTAVVENHSGTELPSTGGMGTTILYIAGGLMVMFAVVMLVTKKRMSVEG